MATSSQITATAYAYVHRYNISINVLFFPSILQISETSEYLYIYVLYIIMRQFCSDYYFCFYNYIYLFCSECYFCCLYNYMYVHIIVVFFLYLLVASCVTYVTCIVVFIGFFLQLVILEFFPDCELATHFLNYTYTCRL